MDLVKMNIKTLTEALVTLLRNNMPAVTNPAGFNWNNKIFPDFPRNDISVESTPRISVTQRSNTDNPIGIGDQGLSGKQRMVSTIFDIDAWVKKGSTIVTADGTFTATNMRDYLSDKVYQIMLDQKDDLKTSIGTIDVEILDVISQPYMDQYEFFRKTVKIRVTYTRGIN
jgi:hypothetical protein